MSDSDYKIFSTNFMAVLSKIADSKIKSIDNIQLDKLISHINLEFDLNPNNYLELPGLSIWLLQTIKLWESQDPKIHTVTFLCHFIGVLSKHCKGFEFIQKDNILNKLLATLEPILLYNDSLKLAIIKLFRNVQNSKSGSRWLIENKYWKVVVNFYMNNSNFYVAHDCIEFLKKFLRSNDDDSVISEMLQEILPSQFESIDLTCNQLNNLNSRDYLSLKLLCEIFKCSITNNTKLNFLELEKFHCFEKNLKSFFSNCCHEGTLDIISSIYVLHLITKTLVDNNKYSEKDMFFTLLEVFENLLIKNQFICIINLGKFCQLQFAEIKEKFNCDTSVQLYFAVFQLVPLLTYECSPENEKFKKTMEKFFYFYTSDYKIYINSFGNKIHTNENLKSLAVRGLLSVCSNLHSLNLSEVTILLNFLVSVLNMFFDNEINNQCLNEPVNKKFKRELHNPADDISVVSAIIKSLSLLIEKFNVNKVEFKDNFNLIKLTGQLLQNEKLPFVVIVDTLLLVKLIIVNIASVIQHIEDYKIFENILSCVFKHIHNLHWEIRDSCIEVLTKIAELPGSENSVLLDLIEEKKFFPLIKSIINGDIESYVRASAVRALSALLKINKIRLSVNLINFSSEIIYLIEKETEGIVRQEAVLLLKQIYSYFNEGTNQLQFFFETMSYLAICDLHWEVKINALLFWEAVIIKILVAHGIPVDSEKKENTIISDESIIKTLYSALNQLSKTGCLYALSSTLINDCDFQVVQTSAKITSNLLDILKSYCNFDLNKLINFNKSKNNENISENINQNLLLENTNINNFLMEKRNVHIEKTISNSEAVIDDIVNEADLSLLANIQNNCNSDQPYTKKILLQELKPEKFLKMLQNFHCHEFLNEKKKWWNIHTDVNSLLEDIIESNSVCDANILDCY